MNLLQNIKDCANILRTVKQKEETRWKENIVFKAIRTRNNSVL